jgi:hypothetical protein
VSEFTLIGSCVHKVVKRVVQSSVINEALWTVIASTIHLERCIAWSRGLLMNVAKLGAYWLIEYRALTTACSSASCTRDYTLSNVGHRAASSWN